MTDLSTLTNDQLMQMHASMGAPSVASQAPLPTADLSKLSDAQLAQMHSQVAPDTTMLLGRFGQGLGDPIMGGTQLAARMADPEAAAALMQAGLNPNEIMNPAGADKVIAQREQEYQASRGGNAGKFDLARLGGNVAATAPIAVLAPGATTIPSMIGTGAAVGAGTAALQPVDDTAKGFFGQKAKQVALGAGTGGITSGAMGAASRLINPNVAPEVQALIDEGVTPTPGQLGGTTARTLEKMGERVPLVGNMPIAAEQRTLAQFNNATLNQVLRPIGEALPQGTPAGNAAIDQAKSIIGKAFDDAYGRLSVRATPEFVNQIGEVGAEVPDTFSKQFFNTVTKQFKGMDPNEEIGGRTLAKARGYFSDLATRYSRDPGAEQQMLGDAYSKVVDAIDDMVSTAHPEETGVQAAKNAWAMFLRARAAAAMSPQNGIFSPSQLAQAIRRYGGEDAFARGKALMQPWVQSAMKVIGSAGARQPQGNLNNFIGAYGLYQIAPHLLDPGTAASAAGIGALYSPLGQRAFSALMTQRPELAAPLAGAITGAAPYTGDIASLLANRPRQSVQ